MVPLTIFFTETLFFRVSNDTTEYKATNLEPGTPYVFSVVSSGSSNSTATSRQFLTSKELLYPEKPCSMIVLFGLCFVCVFLE